MIYEALRDVLLLARTELGFPIEEERYKKIMDDRIVAMKENLDIVYATIRQEVTQRME